MNGLEMVQSLIARGYQPHHAAALAGHFLQESGGRSTALNEKEGAYGLSQWRLDRRTNLENFAKSQGKDPSDPQVQLDFVGHEFAGPEKKAGAAFLATPDVAGASAALKSYIRFGDDSAGKRLENANGLFTQLNGAAPAPVGALATAPVAPAAVDASGTPVAPAAPAGQTMAEGLGTLGKTLAGPAVQFDPVQPLQMARANTGQSQQIAAALARAYGI